jgi:hypothetical protein
MIKRIKQMRNKTDFMVRSVATGALALLFSSIAVIGAAGPFA